MGFAAAKGHDESEGWIRVGNELWDLRRGGKFGQAFLATTAHDVYPGALDFAQPVAAETADEPSRRAENCIILRLGVFGKIVWRLFRNKYC